MEEVVVEKKKKEVVPRRPLVLIVESLKVLKSINGHAVMEAGAGADTENNLT